MTIPPRRLVETVDIISGRRPLPPSLGEAERKIIERVRDLVVSPAISGVGVAENEASGKGTGEWAIVFYVRSKLAESRIEPEALVPPVILDSKGRAVLTDVRAVGKVVAQENIASTPIRSGFSLGSGRGTRGTLAAVVRHQGKLHLLSAKHVLAPGRSSAAGDRIFYPSVKDGGQAPDSEVAILSPFTPYVKGPGYPNGTDAALASVLPEREADLLGTVPGAAIPFKIAEPVKDMPVRLSGRTSGDGARSIVKGLNVSIEPHISGLGFVGFHGQVECASYTAGGDSGALVVAADTGAIVGLHIAGAPGESSFFTPIRRVMEDLRFSFWS